MHATSGRFMFWMGGVAVGMCVGGCNGSGDGTNGGMPGARFEPLEVTLKSVAGSDYMELEDEKLTFFDPTGGEWAAPRGTLTDGASIPRLFLSIIGDRFAKEYRYAALVHDAYCQEVNRDRCPDQYRTKPWRDVHRMFYDGCLAGGTDSLTAKLMFAAVWLRGPRWDDVTRSLAAVPDEALNQEFEVCERWIRNNDPPIDEVVAWMEDREPRLRARAAAEE